jgi:hypothetical protein
MNNDNIDHGRRNANNLKFIISSLELVTVSDFTVSGTSLCPHGAWQLEL